MSTSLNPKTGLRFVSTFLSHSSSDKQFVEAVAEELGHRGVLVWLDRNELSLGPLDTALKEGILAQTTFTIFLSEAAINSEWCKDELKWALEAGKSVESILPIYIGDPLKLVKAHELLRTLFLHPYDDRVNQLGYYNINDSQNPDPVAAAKMIAETAYRRSIPDPWREVVIILDQRGNGPRRGIPEVQSNLQNKEIPTLIFRPSLKPRQQRELLTGEDWKNTIALMTESLSNALGSVRVKTREVTVLGNAQTGLMWAIGRHFNRTTTANLHGYDREARHITNKNQPRLTPLTDGTPSIAKILSGDSRSKTRSVVVVACKQDRQDLQTRQFSAQIKCK